MFYVMTKTITKIGNSQGLLFDAPFMEQARLKVGDTVNVTLHDGGSIIITPVLQPRPTDEARVITPERASAITKRLIRKNRELFRRLA